MSQGEDLRRSLSLTPMGDSGGPIRLDELKSSIDQLSQIDNTGQLMSDRSGRSRTAEGRIKKYQVTVEIRCQSKDTIELIRAEMESVMKDLSDGEFIV